MTQPTYLTVKAALARPWQVEAPDAQGPPIALTDALYVYSRNAYVVGQAMTFGRTEGAPDDGAPVNGATALAWTYDAKKLFASYVGTGREHLVDAAKGDDFAVLHQVAKPARPAAPPPAVGGVDTWPDYSYLSVEGVMWPAPFTMTDGGTSTVEGAFEAVPQKAFDFDFKGAAFTERLGDAPVAAAELVNVNLTFLLYHEPGAPEPAIGAYAGLLDLSVDARREPVDPVCNGDVEDVSICDDATICPRGCSGDEVMLLPGDHARRYSYGNPFEGGQELASFSYLFSAVAREGLPEGEQPQVLQGEFFVSAPAGELSGRPLGPTLGLPRNVTVNGRPAPVSQVSAGVGLTPTVAFEPPAFGAPDSYVVYVIEANDRKNAQGAPVRRERRVASLRLAGTSVTLPEGVLRAGQLYTLRVEARAGGGPPQSTFRLGQRRASATTFTGVFTP
jgi:hypothetical protein